MATDELINLWSSSGSEPRTKFQILLQIGDCYAAISPSNTAALIVPLPEGDPLGRGRVLGSVRLRYETLLQFEVDGRTWPQAAAVIDCLEPKLVRTFCAVVRDVLDRLQATSLTSKQVAAALSAWDDLLRRKGKLTDTSELGLWGELYIISKTADPDAMVDVWRGPLGDTMDFFGGGVAVECKTSAQRHKHHVSHGQATFAGDHISAFVASVWAVEDATSGKTLVNMIDEIMLSVSDEAAFLQKLLAAGYQEEHRPEYLRRFSCPSPPSFFRIEHVPQIRMIDEGITNVRYEVDLSRVPKVSKHDVQALLAALIGK